MENDFLSMESRIEVMKKDLEAVQNVYGDMENRILPHAQSVALSKRSTVDMQEYLLLFTSTLATVEKMKGVITKFNPEYLALAENLDMKNKKIESLEQLVSDIRKQIVVANDQEVIIKKLTDRTTALSASVLRSTSELNSTTSCLDSLKEKQREGEFCIERLTKTFINCQVLLENDTSSIEIIDNIHKVKNILFEQIIELDTRKDHIKSLQENIKSIRYQMDLLAA